MIGSSPQPSRNVRSSFDGLRTNGLGKPDLNYESIVTNGNPSSGRLKACPEPAEGRLDREAGSIATKVVRSS
jgi:hypothetical protein